MGTTTPPLDKAPPADGGLAALQKQLKDQEVDIAKLRQQADKGPLVVPAQQQIQGQPSKEQIEQMFWKDPLPMVDAIAKRAAWEAEQRVQTAGADTNRAIARDKARELDTEVFDEYEAEIERKVGMVAPQFQGNINVWINAFNVTRGEHIDEIAAKKMAKAKQPDSQQTPGRSPSDGPAAPSTRTPAPPKEKPLSDEEKEVARGLKLSESEYRRGKERYANQEKEWEKVVTFDSHEARRARAIAATAKK